MIQMKWLFIYEFHGHLQAYNVFGLTAWKDITEHALLKLKVKFLCA
jgi:hypothetical protein